MVENKMKERGYHRCPTTAGSPAQGAIEYLLLLAASVVVVAIVITFLMNSLQTGTDTGTSQTYDYLCSTLKSNTEECLCYRQFIDGEVLTPPLDKTNDCCTNDKIKTDLKKLLECS